MARLASRPQRWREAASNARDALDALNEARDELSSAMDELQDIQSEYQDWYDNMPEGLQDGPTGEKLTEITDLDLTFDVDFSEAEGAIDAAENADLPQGFGRD